MGRVQARKRHHRKTTRMNHGGKMRRHQDTKHIDQIYDEIKKPKKKLPTPDERLELPGMGNYYCPACDRYFLDDKVLKDHCRTKAHKRRVKTLSVEPFRGSKLPIDNGPPLPTFDANAADSASPMVMQQAE